MLRFAVCAALALAALFFTFLILSRLISPGEPGSVAIIGNLGLSEEAVELPRQAPPDRPTSRMIREPERPGSED